MNSLHAAEDRIAAVLDYHARTKHHLHRFAASLGYLDWATQPDPFRVFDGAVRIELPLSAESLSPASFEALHVPGKVPALPLTRDTVGALFELALGLSAWKEYQKTRWALRCNPSSGNLHPTEGYAVLPNIPGVDAGVYHYLSRDHCLEQRCVLTPESAEMLTQLLQGGILVGLSSIHWRESWKYGERAFRYCQHDIGHAIASVRYAAAALGWKAMLLDVADSAISETLGLMRDESFPGIAADDREHPDALLFLRHETVQSVDMEALRDLVKVARWTGRANVLSSEHVEWTAIEDVARAAWREDGDCGAVDTAAVGGRGSIPRAWEVDNGDLASDGSALSGIHAVSLIKRRRSAVALDDSTSIPAQTFYKILDRLLPRAGVPPWDVLTWPPHLHCGVFVHRVEGLASGLYLFVRNPGTQSALKSALDSKFLFERPAGCPEHLALFRLSDGDFRNQAQVISCQQKIAGAGAFSLGMIADFAESIRSRGSWWYRRLFWEAGLLGHVLYLEAEAAGVRGTGIGCYFDDAFHGLLGIEGNRFQSLYHFTVGGPIEDTRLKTLAPYGHLSRSVG